MTPLLECTQPPIHIKYITIFCDRIVQFYNIHKPKLYHTRTKYTSQIYIYLYIYRICTRASANERTGERASERTTKKKRNKLSIIIWIRNKCATIAYNIPFYSVCNSFICVHRWRTKAYTHTLLRISFTRWFCFVVVLFFCSLVALYFCLYDKMSLLCSTLSARVPNYKRTNKYVFKMYTYKKRQSTTESWKFIRFMLISQLKNSFKFVCA